MAVAAVALGPVVAAGVAAAVVSGPVVLVVTSLGMVALGFARFTTGVRITSVGDPRALEAEDASKRQKTSLICFQHMRKYYQSLRFLEVLMMCL